MKKLIDRCKKASNYLLPYDSTLIVSVNNKDFMRRISNKGFPVSRSITNIFAKSAMYICEHVEGVALAYVHDDYMYLLMNKSEVAYDGAIQNMVSVIASMATNIFNKLLFEQSNAPSIYDAVMQREYQAAKYYQVNERQTILNEMFNSLFIVNVFPVPEYAVIDIFSYLQEECCCRVQRRYLHAHGVRIDDVEEQLKETLWHELHQAYRQGFYVCNQNGQEDLRMDKWRISLEPFW